MRNAVVWWLLAATIGATDAQARFLQVDPAGYQDDLNLYFYTHDDPTDLKDPKGLWSCGKGENSCGKTKDALSALSAAGNSRKLTASQRGKIAKVLAFFGKFSEKPDNVKVDETSGSGALTTPTGNGNFTIRVGTAGGAQGEAGRLGHEGWHGVEIEAHQGNYTSHNPRESWDMEMRAGTLQSWVDHDLQYTGENSFWQPAWTPEQLSDKIMQSALHSTSQGYPGWSMDPGNYDYAARHYEADWSK
jgi:hypothetical protein